MATVLEEHLESLEGFAGELLNPEDAGYDDARSIHNGLIDKRPALIARCRGLADVVATVGLAREHGFELSVRGGGHNVSGSAVTEGGVMLDLSLMKGIHVDPVARTARAQGGVTWGELNRETQLHGLAVTGGVISTTGIAGLTLGGGLGWMMGKYGLACDNLLSAEVVTADGRVLRASADENADLFWGLRGGGGNFGVVTSFEYRLAPVGPIVTGGLIVHPFDAAREVLRFVRDFCAGVPDELTMLGALVHTPDGSGLKVAGIVACHVGSLEQAQAELAPVLEFGSPLDVGIGPMPYTVMNQLLDAAFPMGLLNYWKSTFLRELSDDAIDVMIEQFAVCPSPMTTLVLEHFHGAVSRVPVDATPVPHREPGFNFLIASIWPEPEATDANVVWTRETFDAMEPFAAPGRWLNYLNADETGEGPLRGAYGPNYDSLVELKTLYDPGNLFRLNKNISPRAER
jgi:FAD binding domain/Berberine and berberine like